MDVNVILVTDIASFYMDYCITKYLMVTDLIIQNGQPYKVSEKSLCFSKFNIYVNEPISE